MIIAGETSGDHHGARLVRAMAEKDSDLRFCGIGGAAMAHEGVEIIVDAAQLSVVGITEVFYKLPSVLRGAATIKRAVAERRPNLVILIDFPDFNLRMARYIKRFSIPILYYISPQVWAWRSGRIRQIKQYVDHMAVILPFEADFYHGHDVPVTFVGHPLLDHYPTPVAYSPRPDERPVIGLLPGSRYSEIGRNLPHMLAAASQIHQRIKGVRFIVSNAPAIEDAFLEGFVAPYRNVLDIDLAAGDISAVLTRCTLVVAASGTVTLEAAIHGVPMVIVYRISPLSYMLGRALVRVDHIGLANIIAGERVVPELLQEDAAPSRIAKTVTDFLQDREMLERLREKLLTIRSQLGQTGASDKTAEIALAMIDRQPPESR